MIILKPFLRSFLPREVAGIENEILLAVKKHFSLAPPHLRLALSILSFLFALWFYVSASFMPRDKAIDLWEKIAPPCAAFIRAVRSLSLLHYLEHPAILKRLGALTVPERQERFREIYRAPHVS